MKQKNGGAADAQLDMQGRAGKKNRQCYAVFSKCRIGFFFRLGQRAARCAPLSRQSDCARASSSSTLLLRVGIGSFEYKISKL